ncbi:amino acid/polyamine transporter I [Microdochium trichocladiopsis]|uniref:Amino acid/polyamine transporter I n=1 Tax=Microdochium trichocladiopsis TaxID=1682393 RepID=A0A9P8Y774_9PEZI|nr:amino acid/polyamine transporter I [Microdochium trichocladiopsis]KAH7031539.1 amino acid/polyamine transporter I [Microdochium trichocladiopsis]
MSTPASGPDDYDAFTESQTRTRKLFSFPQLLAFSFMYFITWLGVGTGMYFTLINGGPAAYLFNFIVVIIGVLAQAACLAELASIVPIAGAQYYWTYHYAPAKYRLFMTWIQGWTTWLGYVVLFASALNANVIVVQAVISITHPDYETTGWRTTLFVIVTLVLFTIINVWFFWTVPWFEMISGVLNVCFFVVTMASLWALSPRNGPEFFLTTSSFSGWDNEFISWNLAMLSQIWCFIGFEGVIHMGEEAQDARRSVPKAMVGAIAANGVMGVVMIVTFIVCMPPLEDMLASPSPLIYLLVRGTGSDTIATVIGTGIVFILFSATLGMCSSTSRLTWAWARDGGLPTYFGHVDSKNRVPVRAVLLTCSIVAVLSLLNLGTGAYVALNAVSSLSSLALYLSYVIILSLVLHARLATTTGLRVGEWNLGRWGLPLNVFALVYTLYTMIWLPFPTTLPVTPETMNYCGPVFAAVMSGVVGAWVVWGRRNWRGPNRKIVEIVLRLASE